MHGGGAAASLFLGMGSSRYAALDRRRGAPARRGRDAHAELRRRPARRSRRRPACSPSPSRRAAARPRRSRRSGATGARAGRSASRTGPESALGRRGRRLPRPGCRRGAKRCRLPQLHQHARAAPASLCGASRRRRSRRRRRRAAPSCWKPATAWLAAAAEPARGAARVHVLAPAERIGLGRAVGADAARGASVRADACETGDWSHVDVYLSKAPGLGLLLLRGSA